MTTLLDEYRDDGPLAELVGRTRIRSVFALTLTAVGVLAAAAGLYADGASVTGVASVLGSVVFVTLGMAGGAARRSRRVQWLVPPLLRAGEYTIVATFAWRYGLPAAWLAFLLLVIVAFHHYDIVYRLRHQHAAPSRTVSRLCGGWEGRTIVVTVAAVTGVLVPVMIVLAAWCGAWYVSESLRSWTLLALDETRQMHSAAEIEEEAV
jgi:hypothetical protein